MREENPKVDQALLALAADARKTIAGAPIEGAPPVPLRRLQEAERLAREGNGTKIIGVPGGAIEVRYNRVIHRPGAVHASGRVRRAGTPLCHGAIRGRRLGREWAPGAGLWTSFEVAQWVGGPAGVLCERVLQGLENSWVLRVEAQLHHPVTPRSDKVQPPVGNPKPLSLKDLWRDLLLELFLKRGLAGGF